MNDTAALQLASITAATHSRPPRCRLLVVDDQPVNIQVLYQTFSAEHQVRMAADRLPQIEGEIGAEDRRPEYEKDRKNPMPHEPLIGGPHHNGHRRERAVQLGPSADRRRRDWLVDCAHDLCPDLRSDRCVSQPVDFRSAASHRRTGS